MKRDVFFKAICLFFITCSCIINAQNTTSFKEINGKIIDLDTKNALVFADLVINGSNISTVTNTDGGFLLKIPDTFIDATITISHLGYEKKELKIADIKNGEKIALRPSTTQLEVVNVFSDIKDAKTLVLETLEKRNTLYNNENTLMTAFYRETIMKRKKTPRYLKLWYKYTNSHIKVLKMMILNS